MDMDEKVVVPDGAVQKNWNYLNEEELPLEELPSDMRFNHGHAVIILVLSVLMVISAIGNLTVLYQLVRRIRAKRASRFDVLLKHLAIADLMVTFLMMPLEIAWSSTVQWLAGDFMCRLMMFTRTFGLYLSSFVLICITIDRCFAIIIPLCVTWEARIRTVLTIAWVCAALCSLPQSLIFHLDEHPEVRGYYQCVSYGSLSTETQMFAYFLVNMTLMYKLPLLSTLFCSAAALLAITCRILKQCHKRRANAAYDEMHRSDVGILGSAQARTLMMTVIIVLVFFTCWSPYYYCSLWYWIDKDWRQNLDPAIQKALWLFWCTKPCANPIVYSLFYWHRCSPGNNVRCDSERFLQLRSPGTEAPPSPASVRPAELQPRRAKQLAEAFE